MEGIVLVRKNWNLGCHPITFCLVVHCLLAPVLPPPCPMIHHTDWLTNQWWQHSGIQSRKLPLLSRTDSRRNRRLWPLQMVCLFWSVSSTFLTLFHSDTVTLAQSQEKDNSRDPENSEDSKDNKAKLSMVYFTSFLIQCWLISIFPLEQLKARWHSPIYGFFKPKVTVRYNKGQKYHYFHCAAAKCKLNGSVRHYQDSKDKAATLNLKSHAVRCHGTDIVNTALKKTEGNGAKDCSILHILPVLGRRPWSFHTKLIWAWRSSEHHLHLDGSFLTSFFLS